MAQPLTVKQRTEELKHFVLLAFNAIDEEDYKEISNKTGLCLSTIYRIAAGKISLHTRAGTIQAIGVAAGMQLNMSKHKARVVLVKR